MKLFGRILIGVIGLTSIPAPSASAAWEVKGLSRAKNQAATSPVSSVPLAPAGASEQSFLGYDSGPSVFFPQSAVTGSMWAVRFSPLQSCSLAALSVFSAGGSGSVRVHIFSDKGGLPSQDLIVPFPVELGGDLTDQVIYLPSPLDVGKGEFHVAFELLAGGAPYITGDDDGGSGHSSYAPPGGGWGAMNVSDFALRAFVRYYGPDEIPPQLVHWPPDAAFAEEGLVLSARLSDFSGISEATVHYSINGGVWHAVPMAGTGELFEARLSSVSAGSSVRYFIEARDGAASPNTVLAPANGAEAPFELPVYAGRQIKYDDGTAEDFFVADYQFDDNRFAVRLTPGIFPAQLHTLRAYVNDTAKFFFSVWSDADGRPGRLLSGPWKAGLKETGKGWVNLELPPGSRPIIEKGDFFLVVQWSASSPEQPGIGADGALPDGRSFFYTRAAGWKNWVYNDWMLRASYVASKAGGNRPLRFSLEQNFPNPFNPSTEIRFRLEKPSTVELSVHNVLGQKIRTLVSGNFPGGEHAATWNGRDEAGRPLSSGVYFYRLRSENRVLTRKMVLIK
ncbi:MAG: T9SS type A sorting domain-containing protein [candidate division Zixibacteria bacterium]|nr:T9SS type A sorting domain-containing protein [candidate division Zixibacteria bacterium]